MSSLLEILGRGLEGSIGEVLSRFYWAPSTRTMEQLKADCAAHGDWPDVHLQLGLAQLREMQVDDAIASISAACRRKPDYVAARIALASAWADKGDAARAMDQLKIANQTHPGAAEVLFALGFCCEKLLRPYDAAEYYRDALSARDSFAPARERLAAVALAIGRLDEAIGQYQALIEQEPQETHLHTALAHLYFRNKQYSEAVREFETAIAMEPANWSLVDDAVEALVRDGQVREAIERLRTLLDEQNTFADLHVRIADLYSQAGDDDLASRHYAQALDIQPNYLEAAVKLGTHHLVYGRWEEAAESFGQAAELNDGLLVNYVGMGVARTRQGQKSEAAKCFELASAIEPNSTMLLAEMARLQLKAAVADECTRAFVAGSRMPAAQVELDNDHLLGRQVQRHAEEVAAHPQFADLRYRYGVLLRAEGRLGEAMEQFARAVQLSPAYVQAIIKLGITQQELGMSEQAVATFQQALEIKPQYVDLHYRLGLLYTDRREFEAAAKEMEKAAAAQEAQKAASGDVERTAAGAPGNGQVRAGLALALQNMGLMDRAAAAWHELWRMQHTREAETKHNS
ncbi:MAG: tetratricopeptide repeat protein [Phycisphaerae bacterium]